MHSGKPIRHIHATCNLNMGQPNRVSSLRRVRRRLYPMKSTGKKVVGLSKTNKPDNYQSEQKQVGTCELCKGPIYEFDLIENYEKGMAHPMCVAMKGDHMAFLYSIYFTG